MRYRSDPVLTTVTERLLDRLEDVSGRTFTRAVVLGGAGTIGTNWRGRQSTVRGAPG